MKKGFTLIELLAVIVILAIIALIATPIVLSIINDTKESAMLRSADFYLSGVELSVSQAILKEIKIEDDCKFITWFSLILNRNLKLFIRLRKKKNALNLREEIIDEKKEKEYFVAENNIKYENDNENEDEKYYDFINTTAKGKIEMISKGIFHKIFNSLSISLYNSIDYYINFRNGDSSYTYYFWLYQS